MPSIALQLRGVDYVTELGVRVRAWRAFVEAGFVVPGGGAVRFQCFVDPGAPFSVIPYSLWHGRHLQWTRLGGQLTRTSGGGGGALLWQNSRCELGLAHLYLFDLADGIRSGPHQVIGKFVQQRQLPNLEHTAILGMNFLDDNELRLVLDGTGNAISGALELPGL